MMEDLNLSPCHCEEPARAYSSGVTKQTHRKRGDEVASAHVARALAQPRNDRWAICVFVVLLMCSFQNPADLKGKWEYIGGVYNGKKDNPPTEYTLQRTYDHAHFVAYALEKGYKPEKYEAGNYALEGDTCIETQTFSTQPTKLLNKPVRYLYMVRHDSLILGGKLPTGMLVVEYWKRVK